LDTLLYNLSSSNGVIAQLMSNQAVSILVILNNYFHDVATATLLSSAVVLFVLGGQAKRWGKAERLALARSYKTLTRFARGALAWIILGGIPRTIFFYRAEFIPAAQKNIVPDLMVKHIFLVSAVVIGAIMWVRLGKIAKAELAAGGSDAAPLSEQTPEGATTPAEQGSPSGAVLQ
jgi:hypothetical protein